MRLDFQHCFMVIDLFAAIRAIVKLHLGNDVRPPLVFSGNIARHAPNLVTATGWTNFDLKFVVHGHTAFLDEMRK